MIKQVGLKEMEIIVELAVQLWANHTVQELTAELSELIRQETTQFFIKYEGEAAVGFAQCQIRRDYVEGTAASPVGYLEGIYVKEGFRCRGYARDLLSVCEQWARGRGCQEFASDCEIGNEASILFHRAMNFTEANRIVCFVKRL